MNQDQVNSLVRSGLKVVGGILIAHGATNAAAVLSTGPVIEAICGVVTAIIGIVWSHWNHKADPAPTAVTPQSGK